MTDTPEKEPTPDPEIPDELRSRLSKPHRPSGYKPKTTGADTLKNKDGELATPPEEVKEAKPVRNTSAFFKNLAKVLKTTKPTRTVIEMKDVKRKGEWLREERTIQIPVKLGTGADGLPFTMEPVSADETRRLRSLSYEDAPKMLATHGDLTPEFVEWLYLNYPYDAAVRYAARSTHIQVAAATNH